jgi:hypothetical protein
MIRDYSWLCDGLASVEEEARQPAVRTNISQRRAMIRLIVALDNSSAPIGWSAPCDDPTARRLLIPEAGPGQHTGGVRDGLVPIVREPQGDLGHQSLFHRSRQ